MIMAGKFEREAYAELEHLHRRLSQSAFVHGEQVSVSAGIASFPRSAADRDELLKVVDAALYWAKNHGKNRSCIYTPSVVRMYTPAELAQTAERNARLRAAEGLIRVVDAKDTYAGQHSQSVSRLVEGIAQAMALDEEVVDQMRLAGLLTTSARSRFPMRSCRSRAGSTRRSCAPCASTPTSATGCSRAWACRRSTAGSPPPRVVGRLGLSAGAGRRGDSAGLTHHPGGRRLRCHDF